MDRFCWLGNWEGLLRVGQIHSLWRCAPMGQQPRPSYAAEIHLRVRKTFNAMAALSVSQRWVEVVRPALLSLGRVHEIVCYALGCVHESNVPWQLALLVLLANTLEVPVDRRLVFDPRHGPLDTAVLEICGLTSQRVNECAKRRVMARTLFFMPYASYKLTDNLLRANWGQLHQIILIGNPLQWVADPRGFRWNQRDETRRWQRLGRAPCAEEVIISGKLMSEVDLWKGDMCTWLTGTEERDRNRLNATLTTFRWVTSDMAAAKPLQGKRWPDLSAGKRRRRGEEAKPKHMRTQPSKKRKTRNTGWSNRTNWGNFELSGSGGRRGRCQDRSVGSDF